jgi:hypothetical protein
LSFEISEYTLKKVSRRRSTSGVGRAFEVS